MKLTTVPVIFVLWAACIQACPASAHALHVRRGSELNATLTTRLSSRESRSGDRFLLDVHGAGIPGGTVIQGHIEGVSSFSAGHKAGLSAVFDTLSVRGAGSAHLFAHVLSVAAPHKSTFSRTRGGFALASGGRGELRLARGTRIRLQAVDDISVGEDEPAAPVVREQEPHTRSRPSHEPPPPQSTHPYDAGGEMPY